MIDFTYTPTVEDVRETLYPPVKSAAQRSRSRWRVWASLLLFMLSVGCLLFARYFAVAIPMPATASPLPPALPAGLDNLWLTLVPALLPPLLILALLWVVLVQQKSQPRDRGRSVIMIVFFAMVIGGFFLMSSPGLAIAWNPTPGKMQAVAFCAWIGFLLGLMLIAILMRRTRPRSLFASLAALRRPKRIIIDEVAFDVIDELYRYSYRWGYFKRFAETPNLLVLYLEDGRPIGIPKRAIPSESDDLELRRLLHERIGRGSFLTAQAGFEVLPRPVQALE